MYTGATKVFDAMMKAGAKTIKVTTHEVGPMGNGDTAYERTSYVMYKEDGSVFVDGK